MPAFPARARLSVAVAAGAAIAVGAIAYAPGTGSTAREGVQPNALERRVLEEVSRFTGWLDDHDERGYVAEFGWPDTPRGDVRKWAALAHLWLDHVDDRGVWTTEWSAGEWWEDYRLATYTDSRREGPLDELNVQAEVLEDYFGVSGARHGVNMSGGEFGTPPSLAPTSRRFSNERPGRYDTDYHYDRAATFEFLAERGVEIVRLQFRWERLQPELGGALDSGEVARLRAAIRRAGDAGLKVIVDLHNYADYYVEQNGKGVRQALGSAGLPASSLADFWRRLVTSLSDEPAVLGWGLMNEPAGMKGRGDLSAAEVWEAASQRALSAVRSTGDEHIVFVQGYSYAAAQLWPDLHPDPWISDPVDNYQYEAHHYWDRDNSGAYERSYAEELRNAQARGF
jgi:aryl-phospho-beta-D-glucosidase BglC (GH1 family)